MSNGLCSACQNDDHSNHKPSLAGICIGCACPIVVAEPPASATQIEPFSPLALDIRLMFATLAESQREWQDTIGFGEEGNRLHEKLDDPDATLEQIEHRREFLRNYYIAKLALITTEVAEAIEEIRHNHAIDEAYYPSHQPGCALADHHLFPGGDEPECTCTPKPEGVPSELADIVIRVLSLAGETGIDLGSAIIEKLNYNATRAQRHGGKAI